MTVWMTLRVKGDASKVEAFAAEKPDTMRDIIADAAARGATYHRFYGNDDEVLVVDAWPDEETFMAFFHARTDIAEMMETAATGEPEITFYRKLDTNDDIG